MILVERILGRESMQRMSPVSAMDSISSAAQVLSCASGYRRA